MLNFLKYVQGDMMSDDLWKKNTHGYFNASGNFIYRETWIDLAAEIIYIGGIQVYRIT